MMQVHITKKSNIKLVLKPLDIILSTHLQTIPVALFNTYTFRPLNVSRSLYQDSVTNPKQSHFLSLNRQNCFGHSDRNVWSSTVDIFRVTRSFWISPSLVWFCLHTHNTQKDTQCPLTTHIPSLQHTRPTDESCHASAQSALSCHLPVLRHVVSVGAQFCSALQMCEKQTDVHVCGPPCFCSDTAKSV